MLEIDYHPEDFPTNAAFSAATGRSLPIVYRGGVRKIKVVAPLVQPGQAVAPDVDIESSSLFGVTGKAE